MTKHRPLTEAEMIDIGRWIEMTQAPGRLTISGTPPRPGGLTRILQDGFLERLYNEVLRLQNAAIDKALAASEGPEAAEKDARS